MRRRGFTLLELVLVISLMGLLLAVSVPRMGATYRRSRLIRSVRDLTALLRHARHVAVMRSGGCEVRIDPEEGLFQLRPVDLTIEGEPIDDGHDFKYSDYEEESFRLSDDARKLHELPSDVFFTIIQSSAPLTEDGRPRVLFYPDGSATAAVVGLQNDKGDAFRIDIFKTTGTAMTRRGVPILPRNMEPLYFRPEKDWYKTSR